MWNKFLEWHERNNLQVRWFFIGFFSLSLLCMFVNILINFLSFNNLLSFGIPMPNQAG